MPRFDHLVLRLLSCTFVGICPSFPLAATPRIGSFLQSVVEGAKIWVAFWNMLSWALAFWVKLRCNAPPLTMLNKRAVIKNRVATLFNRILVMFGIIAPSSEISFNWWKQRQLSIYTDSLLVLQIGIISFGYYYLFEITLLTIYLNKWSLFYILSSYHNTYHLL